MMRKHRFTAFYSTSVALNGGFFKERFLMTSAVNCVRNCLFATRQVVFTENVAEKHTRRLTVAPSVPQLASFIGTLLKRIIILKNLACSCQQRKPKSRNVKAMKTRSRSVSPIMASLTIFKAALENGKMPRKVFVRDP